MGLLRSNSITALFTCLAICFLASPTQAKYSGGTGEPNKPYRIATAADMNEIGTHTEDFNKCFVMVNDVNLSDYTGTQFNIIGNETSLFTGVFDGNSHTIFNFTYNSTGTDYIGIFGLVSDPNAEIRNLTLIDPNVNAGTGDGVGSLIGFMDDGTITGCCIDGATILGDMIVGGLVGANFSGTIENCYVTAEISGNNFTGGLVGWNYLGTIESCYASSVVFGGGLGGLAGLNTSTIKNCCSDGEITGKQVVGGLVGRNATNDDGGIGRLENCYSTANVTATTMLAGGLVGINETIVKNCYAAGNIDGNSLTGGLAGVNYGGTLENCYAIGSVEGNSEVGGLVGETRESTIKYCYAVGEVLGDVNTGGLVGSTYDINNDFYTKCFWDSDINPDANGIGNTTDPNVIGKTTSEMQTRNTFTDAGWDFVSETVNGPNDIWTVNEGQDYAKLVWSLVNLVGEFYNIDFYDYSVLSSRWYDDDCFNSNNCDGADFDFSGVLDEKDLKILCDHWLVGVE